MPEPGNCRSCNAPVLWVMTNNGKRGILDAEPSEDGNVAVLCVPDRPTGSEFAVTLSQDAKARARSFGIPLHKSHFVTCPQRGDWKSKT